MKISADLSADILQARREQNDMFKVLKGEKPTTSTQQDYYLELKEK